MPAQAAQEPRGGGVRKPPYRMPLMIHDLSPKFPTRLQVGCTMEKEVRRLKKIHLALAVAEGESIAEWARRKWGARCTVNRMTEIEEELRERTGHKRPAR